MSYLIIDVARTLDEDRVREAETCRRINQALRVRQVQPTHPILVLVGWLRGVMNSSLLTRQETLQGRQAPTS
jgi:hypothetical protein